MKTINYEISVVPNVIEICNIIESHEHEAWVVGGCVRDTLLNKTPNDWDITTSASPQEIESIFGKSFGNGINFGIPFINFKGETYEIAQFRKDIDTNGRFCKTIPLTSIDEDLLRRDFTINAIAYRVKENILKFPDTAMDDLNEKRLICVGDARKRFEEDALRILRYYRFASTLSFQIDDTIRKTIKTMLNSLSILSGERIRKEMSKLLCGDEVEYVLECMKEDGVLGTLFPEIIPIFDYEQHNIHHDKDLFRHSISVVKKSPNFANMRWAALFHDVGKPISQTIDNQMSYHFNGHAKMSVVIIEPILKRLAFSNVDKDYIEKLIEYHDFHATTKTTIRRLCGRETIDFAKDVYAIRKADILSQSDYQLYEKLEELEFMNIVIEETKMLMENSNSKIKLAINGKDLIAIGYRSGKYLGEVLQELEELVYENPEFNTYDILIAKALEKLK